MPVKAAERVAARRQRARDAGLCITCCRTAPPIGRAVCVPCAESASRRTRDRWATTRRTSEWQKIVIAHEREGDKAQEHHLFDDAAQHFQEALSVTAITAHDRLRLLEKLGSASILSGNPNVADPWHGMLDTYFSDSSKAEKVVRALEWIALQRWIDAKTPDAVTFCKQAVEVAKASHQTNLLRLTTLHLIGYLLMLDKPDEARAYLEDLGEVGASDELYTRTLHHFVKGLIAARYGRREAAYEDLEKALALTKLGNSLYPIMSVTSDYAMCGIILGDLERGKALYEQALFIVRRNHMGWLVAQLCTGYASILARMGQHDAARGYIYEALAADVHAPIVEERLAAVGVPLAIYLDDEAMLHKCIRPAALELAFRSHESSRIGQVAAAFARLYVMQGRLHKARALLHKALCFVTYIDECLDFLLVVAQSGARADIPRARELLEKRCHLPSAKVAMASLALFEALVRQRMQKQGEAKEFALQAAKRFDDLQWYAYSDFARSLILLPSEKPQERGGREQPFSSLLLHLTKREQQVVELVLQGHTNRQIAERLAIREHTVEKHMGSIMTSLGIRSRHQLVDAFPPKS